MLNLPVNIDYRDIFQDLMERKERCSDHHITAWQLRRVEPEMGAVRRRGLIEFNFQGLSDYQKTEIGEQIYLLPHAESMLLSRLKVPAGYFHRCPDNMQIDQINYWLSKCRQTLMLRMQYPNDVRAVFGPRFKNGLDDHKVIPLFHAAMERQQNDQNGELILSGYQTDSALTYMTTILTKLQAEYNGTLARAGVALINSEIGCSALHIRPVVFNKRYYRWLDFYAGKGGCTSLKHTRELPHGIVEVAVEKAVQAAQKGVHRLFETMQEEVRTPKKDLEKFIDSSSVVSSRILDSLLEDYEVKELTTKYQIAEDILLACKDLPLFKQHVVKVEVGKYLDLFGADEARMDALLDD